MKSFINIFEIKESLNFDFNYMNNKLKIKSNSPKIF